MGWVRKLKSGSHIRRTMPHTMRKLRGSCKSLVEPQGALSLVAAPAANVKKVREVGRSHHTSLMSECHENVGCHRAPLLPLSNAFVAFWRQLGCAAVLKEGHLQAAMTSNPNLIQHLKLSRYNGKYLRVA